jgi:hypothetical protein
VPSFGISTLRMQVKDSGYIIKRWVRLEPFLKTSQKLGPIHFFSTLTYCSNGMELRPFPSTVQKLGLLYSF